MQSIQIDNIQAHTSQHVCDLFNLIEQEQSPFTISKKGKIALDALCTASPNLNSYRPFIERTLSVRTLQQCKNFYRNMKLSKLQNMLQFYSNETSIERLLYECNREGLISTTISFQNGEGSMTFTPESQVAENLFTFGAQLKVVFNKVVEATSRGKAQRLRIFQKVKEKLEEEASDAQRHRQEMAKIQQELAEQKAKEKAELEKKRLADVAR